MEKNGLNPDDYVVQEFVNFENRIGTNLFVDQKGNICTAYAVDVLRWFPIDAGAGVLIVTIDAHEVLEEVYVPFWGDMQKDHRLVCEAAMVVLRAKYKHPVQRIYAYETLSETGINLPNAENAFLPNVFEDISDYLEQKLHALHFFASQMSDFPDLRSYQAVEALARLRGATADLPAAEAFMLIREIKRVGER